MRGRRAWLIGIGAAALLVSLFLTWSHQPSHLQGVPGAATAWQVYTWADVALAILAVALVAAGALGGLRVRLALAAAALLALAFVAHALAVPPTNGLAGVRAAKAGAGVGETLAIVGLLVALAGLTLGKKST